MLFVSHANPEDNLFTRWLSLRLAREGYPVWCDLTKLLGGEDFWKDVEAAMRDRTTKFLFVLSKTSNQKQGTLDELALARRVGKQLQDFIIPLHIDDLRSDDITIELQRIAYIDFSKSWVVGYGQLLEALEKAGVARDPRFTPDAVTTWWREHFGTTDGVKNESERYLSNWFEFASFPDSLFLHSVRQSRKFEKLVSDGKFDFAIPAYCLGRYVLTFGDAEEIAPALDLHDLTLDNTVELQTTEFRDNGCQHPQIERKEARNILTVLLRTAFQQFATNCSLLPYELSGGAKYFWFKSGLVKDDKMFFSDASGARRWKGMVGFKSLTAKEGETRIRNWHFGIQGKPHYWPFFGFAIKPHVAFTENGALYDSKAKQHSARRSQCKDWYNDDWAYRILGAMSFLAGESKNEIIVPLAAHQSFALKRLPMLFESPLSYEVLEVQPEVETPDREEVCEDESDIEEEEQL